MCNCKDLPSVKLAIEYMESSGMKPYNPDYVILNLLEELIDYKMPYKSVPIVSEELIALFPKRLILQTSLKSNEVSYVR